MMELEFAMVLPSQLLPFHINFLVATAPARVHLYRFNFRDYCFVLMECKTNVQVWQNLN
jgi:hypothetical protein